MAKRLTLKELCQLLDADKAMAILGGDARYYDGVCSAANVLGLTVREFESGHSLSTRMTPPLPENVAEWLDSLVAKGGKKAMEQTSDAAVRYQTALQVTQLMGYFVSCVNGVHTVSLSPTTARKKTKPWRVPPLPEFMNDYCELKGTKASAVYVTRSYLRTFLLWFVDYRKMGKQIDEVQVEDILSITREDIEAYDEYVQNLRAAKGLQVSGGRFRNGTRQSLHAVSALLFYLGMDTSRLFKDRRITNTEAVVKSRCKALPLSVAEAIECIGKDKADKNALRCAALRFFGWVCEGRALASIRAQAITRTQVQKISTADNMDCFRHFLRVEEKKSAARVDAIVFSCQRVFAAV